MKGIERAVAYVFVSLVTFFSILFSRFSFSKKYDVYFLNVFPFTLGEHWHGSHIFLFSNVTEARAFRQDFVFFYSSLVSLSLFLSFSLSSSIALFIFIFNSLSPITFLDSICFYAENIVVIFFINTAFLLLIHLFFLIWQSTCFYPNI